MKILFLDIDGVVLPGRAHLLPNQTRPLVKTFDPCAVSLLNEICRVGEFQIVIHSSWLRYWPDGVDGVTITEFCIVQGIKSEYFHAHSECDGNFYWRYDRIDDWLSRHEVDDYVILDDTPPDEGYPRAEKVILTDFDEGITMAIFRQLTGVRK